MTENPHPLDPATADEYLTGRKIMADAGLLADPVRFAYYGLEEPPKQDVLGGAPADRRLRAYLLNLDSGESTDVVVSLTQASVISARVLDTAAEGQLPIIDSEYHLVEEIVAADPDWQAALARRGLTDMSKIRICPITAGAFRAPAEDDARRMVRVLAFLQADEHDLAWAHPVDGVTAHVDLIEKKVLRVTDEFILPVPAESGDYDDPAVRGPERTGLRPIEITQPEGPSFTLDGTLLRWQGWSLRVGFDLREGLTLHQIELAGRPVIYRASIPEMVVPYGDPRFRYWQSYFDTGEYLVGKWVNSLELGCDCLGEISYLDAVVTGETGEPRTVRNAICIHEEDAGILWKHTDIFNGSAQSRRQRRLVVSFFTTVGNYDYGFYWYFYLDGTIECEVKMTGVVFTAAHPGGDDPYSTEVAPGLGAPVHQHLFSARLDMSVDGLANAVEEVDVTGLPIGPDNPYGNAIGAAGDPADLGGVGRPARRRLARAGVADSQHDGGEPVRQADRVHAAPRAAPGPARPSGLAAGGAGGLRHPGAVGDPLRPGRALSGRRLRQPEPRRRAARVRRGRPGHRRAGHRRVAHVRADARRPDRGLAGDAGLQDRLHAPADRLLRPQPHARRAGPSGHCHPG